MYNGDKGYANWPVGLQRNGVGIEFVFCHRDWKTQIQSCIEKVSIVMLLSINYYLVCCMDYTLFFVIHCTLMFPCFIILQLSCSIELYNFRCAYVYILLLGEACTKDTVSLYEVLTHSQRNL